MFSRKVSIQEFNETINHYMAKMNHAMEVTTRPRHTSKRGLKAFNNSHKRLHVRCYSEVLNPLLMQNP